jgi:hypothetical protein
MNVSDILGGEVHGRTYKSEPFEGIGADGVMRPVPLQA